MYSIVVLLGLSLLCGLVSGSALNLQQWSKSYLRISARCVFSLLISSSELWCTQFSTKSYKHIIFKLIFICSPNIVIVDKSYLYFFCLNNNVAKSWSKEILIEVPSLNRAQNRRVSFQISWNFWKQIPGWNRWIRR
jgi:hypothetical protein